MKIKRLLEYFLTALIPLSALLSCTQEGPVDKRDKDYGYVQFKVYKEASYQGTKASLDYLGDASKVMVMLRTGDVQISQTMTLSYSDAESAEYGVRSSKLKLLAGNYDVIAYTIYDKLDNAVYKGGEAGSFEVVEGGLCVHDLTADVTERGKASFSFVKFFPSGTTKAGSSDKEYTFDEITKVELSVLEKNTGVRTEIKDLKTEFSIHFDETDDKEDGYRTSSLSCDALVSLRAGEYTVETYALFNEYGDLLEIASPHNSCNFSISDNEVTEVKVPVTLNESAAYIKDYYSLKEIWESLDGSNWYYVGEDYTSGANWDFNKSVDLWGEQPGVQLHSNGRVAFINISDFGFKGDLSPAIGNLTELVELYLGSHNDKNKSGYDPQTRSMGGSAARLARHKEYLSGIHPLPQMSEPIARALKERNISIPEIALYDRYSESEIMEMERNKVTPLDMIAGKLNNGLRSLPEEIGKLGKLEQLYIANGEIRELPSSMASLKSLLELEVYNCSKMTRCPEVIGKIPNLEVLNFGNNNQLLDGEAEKLIAALSQKDTATLQILYMNNCNLRVLDGAAIGKMNKIGLLDLANNKIEKITEAFGQGFKPVQIYLSGNKLSSLPVDEDGFFCNTDDIETFSCSGNEFTEFPDIFSSESVYVMGSIDFSANHISRFQNAGNGYKGINATTINLNNNPELTEYPKALAESGSWVSNLNFRGCSLEKFPKGCFKGDGVQAIQSIDFSYNHLTKMSDEFIATNVPYLYGLDLSYNRFASFPWEPLDCSYLTVFAIRSQRNAAGERCLSEWPTGIYQHKGLRGFYIGSNNLGLIDDTISTICYYLDISDNPEIIFDASDICTAYARGQYLLIYDKTQDIRNCEYIALD